MTIRPNNAPSLAETPSIHRMWEFVNYTERVSAILGNMTAPERARIIAMFHEAWVTIAEIHTNPAIAMMVHGLLARYNQDIRAGMLTVFTNTPTAANNETFQLTA